MRTTKQLFFAIGLATSLTSLVACQPQTDTSSHDATHTEHDEHAHEEHDEHEAHEHDKHEEHEAHTDEEVVSDEHAVHDEHTDHDEHAGHDHSGHNHDSGRIKYDCEPAKTIGVFYHEDATPSTAHLLIDGIEYDLTQVSSETGKRYASDIGIVDQLGMTWSVTQDKAILSTIPLEHLEHLEHAEHTDHTDSPSDEKTIYTCSTVS